MDALRELTNEDLRYLMNDPSGQSEEERIQFFLDMTYNESSASEKMARGSLGADSGFDYNNDRWLNFNVLKRCWEVDESDQILLKVEDQVTSWKSEIVEIIKDRGSKKQDEAQEDPIINELYKTKEFLISLGNHNRLKNLVRLLQPKLAVSSLLFDSHKDKLCALNGTICLRTGQLITHLDTCKKMRHTLQLPFEYQIGSEAPIFQDVLNTMFTNDQELIHYMQVLFGYFLTAEISQQKIYIFYGSGANGKTILTALLLLLLAKYGCTIPTEVLMENRYAQSQGPTPDLERINGKRLIVASEGKYDAPLNLALIKQLSGGNSMTARALYRQVTEFKPAAKLVLETNFLPKITVDDHATWRRMAVIPFNVVIAPESRDPHLLAKLTAEMPGILNWCVRGAVEYYEKGFPHCKSIEDATLEYQRESDPITSFLENTLIKSEGDMIRAHQLYERYESWAISNGYKPLTEAMFGRSLKTRGYEKTRLTACRMYLNHKFKETEISDILQNMNGVLNGQS